MSAEIKMNVLLPDDFPFSVFVTALEGGINYWYRARTYRWQDAHGNDDLYGFHAYGTPIEEDNERLIDRETVLCGLAAVCGSDDIKLNGRWRDEIRRAAGSGDAGLVDADLADSIVQAGLFGEIVYG